MATTAALAQISNLAARCASARTSLQLFTRVTGTGSDEINPPPPILKAAHGQPLTSGLLFPAIDGLVSAKIDSQLCAKVSEKLVERRQSG